jgi:hypothetical protein
MTRLPMIGAIAAGLLIAVVPPAVAAASPPPYTPGHQSDPTRGVTPGQLESPDAVGAPPHATPGGGLMQATNGGGLMACVAYGCTPASN